MKLKGVTPRTELILFFVLVFITYSYFPHSASANCRTRFDLVRAIVEQGTFRIDSYHENTIDKAIYKGHYYTDTAPGASFLAVPVYFLVFHVVRLLKSTGY